MAARWQPIELLQLPLHLEHLYELSGLWFPAEYIMGPCAGKRMITCLVGSSPSLLLILIASKGKKLL